MGKKSSKFEKDGRVEEVRKMMIFGTSRDEVIRYAKEKWQISERTVDYYIAEAREINFSSIRTNPQEVLANALAHRQLLRSQAYEQNDLRLAFKIAQDEAKLLGLYNINKPPRTTGAKK